MKGWSRRKRLAALGGAALALLLAAVAGLDHWLPYMLLSHYKFPVERNPRLLAERGIAFEPVAFTTSDGVRIAGWYIPAPRRPEVRPCTLLVLHTLGRTRADMLAFSLPLHERGFDLALIDLRGHGESGGKYFTYGFHEWRDVTGAIDWLERRGGGAGRRVAVVGASAGGAVAVSAAAREPRIRALVTLAAFADLEEIVLHQARWLPRPWARRALGKAERIADFRVRDASPRERIRRVACPVLLVHGTADGSVPYACAGELLAAAGGPAELYPVEGADHASLFARGGEALADRIAEFLREACGGE